jgi:DNA-binding Xre family transcriptional regulator
VYIVHIFKMFITYREEETELRIMKLGMLIIAHRQKHDLSLRELSKSIGISHATLQRIETGKDCDVRSFTKILEWMMKP